MNRLMLVLALTSIAATGAVAQTRKGYKEPGIGTLVGGRKSSMATQSEGGIDETRRIVQPVTEALERGRRTARCVARVDAKRAGRFVLAGPEIPARTAYGPIQAMMENCLSRGLDVGIGAVDMSRRILQGFISEALVRQSPPLALAPLPLDQAQYPKDLAGEPAAQRVVTELAVCLAYTQPAKTEALVRTEPGTPEERAAFTDLTPSLQACVPKDMTLEANKAGVRLAASLALFRRASAPPVQNLKN